MSTVIIYKIQSLKDNKVYIGSTINLKSRWKCHRTGLRKGNHHSKHLQYAWNLYGEDNFVLEIIATPLELFKFDMEQFWINEYDACNPEKGYNLAPLATGGCVKKHSEETKNKIRLSHLGKIKSPEHCRRLSECQIGKNVSSATRAKLSAACKGRVVSKESIARTIETKRKNGTLKLSEDARRKISEKAIGRVVSEETRKKLSTASKGRKWASTHREKMSLIERQPLTEQQRVNISKGRGFLPFNIECPDGSILTFETLSQAKNVLGLDPSNVQKCLIGKARKTKGYICYRNP